MFPILRFRKRELMSKAIAGKKAAAFSAAFAIALSAGVVGADANVAHAQSEAPAATATTTADADQQQGNSNPENAPKDGLSLTIHKLKGTETGQQGNGTEQNLPNDPAKGVDYTIELVQPLNTPKDWKTAADIKNAAEAKAFTGEGAYSESRTTDDKGEIKLTGLKPGLYKVTETKVPAGSGLVIAKPFLVYVPMTTTDSEGNSSWLKDVHAYPKNTEVKVEKKVKDQFANNGEDYTYTITSSIPLKKEGETLSKYIVTDELDSQLDGAASEVAKVTLGEKEADATELVAGKDYTVESTDNNQTKKVVFTADGLKKLDSSSKQVFTTIKTKTKADATVYHVPNDAELTVSHDPKGEYDTTVTTDEVHTYWGDLKIVKQDGNDTNKKLEGATFELVQCQADGDAWKQTLETSAETVKGKTSWTTDKNGTVTIEGIHVTDFADNEKKANDYCLKETKAPKGYVKNDALIPFELKKEGNVAENGVPTKKIEYTATVDNYSDKNHLPNTGGAGFIAIVMAGLAIIGGGFFAARRNSAKA